MIDTCMSPFPVLILKNGTLGHRGNKPVYSLEKYDN